MVTLPSRSGVPVAPYTSAAINACLDISAMTGKLVDRLPMITMSSLMSPIPDHLYQEEDIPTSMNIFSSTDSMSHYSQMSSGKADLLVM